MSSLLDMLEKEEETEVIEKPITEKPEKKKPKTEREKPKREEKPKTPITPKNDYKKMFELTLEKFATSETKNEEKTKELENEIKSLKIHLMNIDNSIHNMKSEIPIKEIEINFNEFMEKLEVSKSFSAKHLIEKLNVKGKYRKVNKERILRIIRDTIDIINETE